MIQPLAENLFLIQVTLPDNPLKYTNTYLVKGERCLLIDTGLDDDLCEKEMRWALRSLGVELETLDILLTHSHNDHVGLAHRLLTPESRVYCSRRIGDFLRHYQPKTCEEIMESWGAPIKELGRWRSPSPHIPYSTHPNLCYLSEGDILEAGGYRLRYLETPGHMFDHGCFYEEDKQLLFCGDMILNSITPGIFCQTPEDTDLADFVHSLDRLEALAVSTAYGGHGSLIQDCAGRVREIKAHHQERLDEVLELLDTRELTVMETAMGMGWNLPDKDWHKFSPLHKYCSMGEAVAHLGLLYQKKRIRLRREGPLFLFSRR